MGLLYDPPSGWRYGFPKPYRPLEGETLEDTLLRDGYPQREIDNGGAKYCRFMGDRAELDAMAQRQVECDNDNRLDLEDEVRSGRMSADEARCRIGLGPVPVAAQAQPEGFLAGLTGEQREAALSYRGPDSPVGYANPISRLRNAGGFVYLGSPYSLYPDYDEAADIVAAAAAGLMAQGLVVYSPIAHGHYVSQQGDLPTSWEFWKAQCQPLIDAASALAVLKMEGWGKSVGLQYEIGEFRRAGKPVVFLDSEAGWRRHDEPMCAVEARHDREASRADWEYQFRKEQEAA